jgi:hypothetical protein
MENDMSDDILDQMRTMTIDQLVNGILDEDLYEKFLAAILSNAEEFYMRMGTTTFARPRSASLPVPLLRMASTRTQPRTWPTIWRGSPQTCCGYQVRGIGISQPCSH